MRRAPLGRSSPINNRHYVPILKCKRGEKSAINAFSSADRRRFTPLIEIPELQDPVLPKPPKTLEQHLKTAISGLRETFAGPRRFFLEAHELEPLGSDAPSRALEAVAELGLAFIPVTGLRRSQDETSAALRQGERGIALRLTRDDLDAGGLDEAVATFLGTTGVVPANVDLMLDIGPVDEMIPSAVSELARDLVLAAPTPALWRSFTLLGCAFPKSMAGTPTDDHRFAARSEWLAWKDLLDGADLTRIPTFGDCVIQHSSGVEGFDPRIHQVAATIRYACDTDWLLIKGHSTDVTPAAEQFPVLARKLGQHGPLKDQFRGAGHCLGCEAIERVQDDPHSFTTPEAWRRVGTIHHVATVLDQLASLPDSSGP